MHSTAKRPRNFIRYYSISQSVFLTTIVINITGCDEVGRIRLRRVLFVGLSSLLICQLLEQLFSAKGAIHRYKKLLTEQVYSISR